jgi:hypothetical protein
MYYGSIRSLVSNALQAPFCGSLGNRSAQEQQLFPQRFRVGLLTYRAGFAIWHLLQIHSFGYRNAGVADESR